MSQIYIASCGTELPGGEVFVFRVAGERAGGARAHCNEDCAGSRATRRLGAWIADALSAMCSARSLGQRLYVPIGKPLRLVHFGQWHQ